MGCKYKLLGFNSPDKSANILIMTTGKVMKIDVKELEKSELIDDFSVHEIKSIYRKIYSTEKNQTTAYDFKDRHENSWLIYSFLILLLSVFYIFSNLAAAKPVYI